MSVRALILDFGEVLVHPQPPRTIERMAQLARLTVAEFNERYWAHRLAYDAGLPAPDYWRLVVEAATPSDIRQLIDADYESWTVYREELWTLTEEFRVRGGRTAILSNGVPEIMGRVRTDRDLARYFDVVVVSCDVGRTKPDPAIYRICLERLGVTAGSALFVDDRAINVEAAAHLGLQTLLFTGDRGMGDLRERLKNKRGGE